MLHISPPEVHGPILRAKTRPQSAFSGLTQRHLFPKGDPPGCAGKGAVFPARKLTLVVGLSRVFYALVSVKMPTPKANASLFFHLNRAFKLSVYAEDQTCAITTITSCKRLLKFCNTSRWGFHVSFVVMGKGDLCNVLPSQANNTQTKLPVITSLSFKLTRLCLKLIGLGNFVLVREFYDQGVCSEISTEPPFVAIKTTWSRP